MRQRRRQRRIAALLIIFVLIIGAGAAGGIFLLNRSGDYASDYAHQNYNTNLYQGSLFASDLCVTSSEVSLSGFEPESELHAAGLFDIEDQSVVCGYQLFDRLYPASTTKIMTAYIALKYGNMEDVVTVSANATDFADDEVTSGLETGDEVSMYDLVCGLLLHSGNDCATAIAEHMSGSIEDFADLMNQEAAAMGATGTHFTNPHGLHDENHYTTAYDLYLIFNQCIKNDAFVEIISMSSYTGTLHGADGTDRAETWTPTQFYGQGMTTAPEGVRVLGGKTGTTELAGNCVILYDQNEEGRPYISVIMGADGTSMLYEEMNEMMEAGIDVTPGADDSATP